MDSLVQSKIRAAIQPLIHKIHLLEGQVKNMETQIQTLHTLQSRLTSQSFSCTQSQTQQTRLETKVVEKPKTAKQNLAQKVIHPKKDTNVPKTMMKTQVHPGSHNPKKQAKKQISKPKGHSPKEAKGNNQEMPQKQRLMTEQEKISEMVEQRKEQFQQKTRMNELQSIISNEINSVQPNNLNQLSQDISKDKLEELTINKTEFVTTEFHQGSLIQKILASNAHQSQCEQQAQSLKIEDNKDQAKNQAMLPNVEVQNNSILNQITMNYDVTKLENQNVDNQAEKIEKMEPSQSLQNIKENQANVQQNQSTEVTNQNFSILKQQKPDTKCQNSKPSGKSSKDIKTFVSPSVKKQPISKKPVEQNREKMTKSSIVTKQKIENKQSRLITKGNGIKQKNGGKSVDPAVKKAQGKYQNSEKKSPEIIYDDQLLLNQECTEQSKIEKKHQVELLLEHEVEKAM